VNELATADVLRRPARLVLFYVLPLVAMLSTRWLGLGLAGTSLVWVAGLTIMGLACVSNARRCGRVHCYFTGPWFLIAALAFVLYGFELVQPSWLNFTRLANITLFGGVALWILPELILGKYFGNREIE
jgi:hypothetical protein